MEWTDEGIVLGVRRHGESSAIAELLTRSHGRHLGLVRGGASSRMRPMLQPGNTVRAVWRARLDEHLGNFRVEPLAERSGELVRAPFGAFGLALAASHLRLLPERDPHPRLYDGLAALLDSFESPPLAAESMVRFELLLLDEMGFGLDLSVCAATGGTDDLIYVSPRSGRAVSRAAGEPYADRLLPLPGFLGRPPGMETSLERLAEGFLLTGYFLERHVFDMRGEALPEVRLSFLRAVSAPQRPAGEAA